MNKLFSYLALTLAIVSASANAAQVSKEQSKVAGPVTIYNATGKEILWWQFGKDYQKLQPKGLLRLKAYSRKNMLGVRFTADSEKQSIDLGDAEVTILQESKYRSDIIEATHISKEEFDKKYKAELPQEEQKKEKGKK